MFSIGQWALISIFSHFFFIYFTWRVLIAINMDPIIRKGRVTEARILMFFVAIAVGSGVSRFFLDILQWSGELVYLF